MSDNFIDELHMQLKYIIHSEIVFIGICIFTPMSMSLWKWLSLHTSDGVE